MPSSKSVSFWFSLAKRTEEATTGSGKGVMEGGARICNLVIEVGDLVVEMKGKMEVKVLMMVFIFTVLEFWLLAIVTDFNSNPFFLFMKLFSQV